MRAANHQSLIKISSWAPRLSSISFCSASTDRLCPWCCLSSNITAHLSLSSLFVGDGNRHRCLVPARGARL
jgi:hypothetical protein